MAEESLVIPGEVAPVEVKARELGWRPLEEYEGPEEKWVDAGEFVSRQPLFEKIDSLKSELWKSKQEHQKEFTQIKQHFNDMKEVEFKRALEYLKTQKSEAIESGDSKLVVQIDDQIDELKDQRAAEKIQQTPPEPQGPNPDFAAWAEKNSWYAQDADLRDDADAFAMAFISKNPQLGKDVKAILNHVDKKMAALHSNELGGNQMRKQTSVEPSTNTTTANRGKQKFGVADLSSDERSIMKTLVDRKVMTQEKYIEDLAKAKGLI